MATAKTPSRVNAHAMATNSLRPDSKMQVDCESPRSGVVMQSVRARSTGWNTEAALGAPAVFALLSASLAAAQAPALPPIRALGPIVATAPDSFANIQGVFALSGGRVIVRDATQLRVLLFDATLTHSTPIMDNTGATPRRYVGGMGGIDGPYAFRADSTFYFDAGAEAMILVDPAGTVVRVTAPPVTRLANHYPVGDGHGHLVMQAPFAASHMAPSAADTARAVGGHPVEDSYPLWRADLATHRIDTIAIIRDADTYIGTRGVDSCGAEYFRPVGNPLPSRDAWVVLSSGTVAVVRAHDFHIDWIALDGTTTASPKLPHEWTRLSDSNKVALTDSLRRGLSTTGLLFSAAVRSDGATPAACVAVQRRASAPDYPTPENMADYAAPFPPYGAVFGDADDHVWIQTADNPAGGTGHVYLVVDRKGVVIDRVQVPGGANIAGFGPGVVYLRSRVGRLVQLARARFR
ncbi:MAG TPA: hypothetical protein VMH39_11630 [Gemmatimonadaceae bacterium]|nr:hypothetical protein [Gemmatimonadaceae bacterium]